MLNDALDSGAIRSSLNITSGSQIPQKLFVDTLEDQAAPTVPTDVRQDAAVDEGTILLRENPAIEIGIPFSHIRKFRV